MSSIPLFTNGMLVAVKITTPLILVVLAVGLAVAVLQALTQIQEQSLPFVFKLGACVVMVLLLGPWFGTEIRALALHGLDMTRFAGR
jgi:type III secretion protein S